LDRLIKQILVFVLTLFAFNNKVLGQIEDNKINSLLESIPKEKVFLHTNTNLVLAGEEIYYKLYSLYSNNKLSNISKIAYVELIGEENTFIFKHKLKLNYGVASGDFFIPSTTKTGNYKLIGYTKLMNSELTPIYKKDIFIINPYISTEKKIFQEVKQIGNVNIEIKNNSDIITKENDFEFFLDSDLYKRRSKVSLELKNLLKESNFGNYSLSVRKLDAVGVSKKENNKNKYKDIVKKSYLPEIRGEVISGKVISLKDSSIQSNVIVSLSISGKNYIFKNVKTNEFGKFYFNIHENYEGNKIVLQVVDSEKEEYKIVLDKPFDYYNFLTFNNLILNKNIKKWLLEKSIQNQVQSAYYYSKKDSLVALKPSNVFYDRPSVEYILDDYKRFPTVKETFIEVVEEAAMRKDKDSYRFMVYDYEERRNNSFKNLDPLVLFDGIQIQNNNDIIDYETNGIDKVSVVRGIYFYGPSIFNGIIDFKTKKGDFKLPYSDKEYLKQITHSRPIEDKLYFEPNYNKESSNKFKRIPDYRNQLLWVPNIYINSSSKKIEFYTSDIEGKFEILLEGFTINGKYIYAKKNIIVKDD